ncbi:hypothetical protein [Sphingomonas koreensis]
MSKLFAKETELVAAFLECLDQCRWSYSGKPVGEGWIRYAETAGWDLLLAHAETAIQVGVEAKLSLNPKVLCQALNGANSCWAQAGPDYRAVLVPSDACQLHMETLAAHLGLTVIKVGREEAWNGTAKWRCNVELPTEQGRYSDRGWYSWLPAQREKLPEYVPDCIAGAPSPVALTQWKVRAIRLMILLERRGAVTRKDMQALDLSPTRWTERTHGFLVPGDGGYVRGPRTPDLKAQHPRNWTEIDADFESWNPHRELAAA